MISGGESTHILSNDNGISLINFAMENKMNIMGTHFKRKKIYKETWIIPGTKETNQINHVLIGDNHARRIIKIRTFHGAGANSDHFLVVAQIEIEKPKVRLEKQERRHSRYEMKEKVFRERGKKRKDLEECAVEKQKDEIEQQWSKIESAINKATDKTLSKRITQKKKE
ncbi:hypothetical protein ILUMI_16947 [Ignelater luminosus]|uniref:Uncharacterized protein n=1 Tax=Ignelater luminosus TaxID=2038154 RepID=A0A8K0CQB4_IGNLU|nr:hypothetical protein ILUMI_16947 [Ignelater luminosus]